MQGENPRVNFEGEKEREGEKEGEKVRHRQTRVRCR